MTGSVTTTWPGPAGPAWTRAYEALGGWCDSLVTQAERAYGDATVLLPALAAAAAELSADQIAALDREYRRVRASYFRDWDACVRCVNVAAASVPAHGSGAARYLAALADVHPGAWGAGAALLLRGWARADVTSTLAEPWISCGLALPGSKPA